MAFLIQFDEWPFPSNILHQFINERIYLCSLVYVNYVILQFSSVYGIVYPWALLVAFMFLMKQIRKETLEWFWIRHYVNIIRNLLARLLKDCIMLTWIWNRIFSTHLYFSLKDNKSFFNQWLQSSQRRELCHSSKPNLVTNGFVMFYRNIPSRKEYIVVWLFTNIRLKAIGYCW